MESNRATAHLNKKQRVILLKKDFPFIDKLEVGVKGQILIKGIVKQIDLLNDMDGNDMREIEIKISKAEIIDNSKARVMQ